MKYANRCKGPVLFQPVSTETIIREFPDLVVRLLPSVRMVKVFPWLRYRISVN